MPIHSLHVFDRKGKTLFTKTYVRDKEEADAEARAEQRKLVFGMLFSLREVAAALAPEGTPARDLRAVRTGASTLYSHETASGLRFALYATGDAAAPAQAGAVHQALQHVYEELWIQFVVRSPLYRPRETNVGDTNFEAKLDAYLGQQVWFR